MPDWSRANAMLAMTSPLGADVLIPISFTAQEAISQPFQFEIQAVSQNGVIKTDDLLNQPVCILLQTDGQAVRYFHGIVRSVSDEGAVRAASSAATYELYRIVAVPRLWFLSQTTDCRVYENESADAIIKAMFNDAGLTDMTVNPSGATRPYTVQFNETDLHFATRLMEEEGWYYFFTHEAGKHTLVIADSNSSFTDISGATLHIAGGADTATQLIDFHGPSQTVRGQMTLKDYDPDNADTQLQSVQPTTLKTGGAPARDDFRWPALSFDNGMIKNRATWDMEAAEAIASLFSGSTRYGGLVPGGKFTVASQPAAPQDGAYVVRGANHHAVDDTWLNESSTASYLVRFTAFLSAVTWRQPIVTPRPRMDGIHTGQVMGPQDDKGSTPKSQNGEEIYTDDMGRVKVRFYWDWRAEATGNNAVWARVIQPWAGKGWGAQFTPRVGTEVAVAFVDGDPDRPMVIGGLYNSRDTAIYAQADKNKLGFRTRSVPKGAQGTNFSEFTIDDTKGSELIFFHAEKDYFTEIENNQTLTVDNCRIVTVKQNETVDIQNNQTITVKQDHVFTVSQGNRSVKVSQGNNTFEVTQGNHSEKIGQGNHTHEVTTGNYSSKIGTGNWALDVQTGNHDTKVDTGNVTLKIAMGNQTDELSLGNYSMKTDVGSVTIEALQGITLKVGANSVKIDMTGVAINGVMVKLAGTAMFQAQAPISQVSADAMLTLKGGITMIN
ncbi:MAG TPA: type VI secretion system tip protein TssI/VgrG [Acetobacteraceae bacterium]|jgi:type VI secretion system secreted protein VgrG